jgi:hypothetical protein
MKHVKKLASLLLALVMVLGLATHCQPMRHGNDGSITIKQCNRRRNLRRYKVFDLTTPTMPLRIPTPKLVTLMLCIPL